MIRQGYLQGGRGQLVLSTGANPGAGNLFSAAVLTTHLTRILYFQCNFTADANPANRVITLLADDATTEFFFHRHPVLVTANQSGIFNWGMDLPHFDSLATTSLVQNSLSKDFILRPGDSLKINVANIQAGDALTGIVYYQERYYL